VLLLLLACASEPVPPAAVPPPAAAPASAQPLRRGAAAVVARLRAEKAWEHPDPAAIAALLTESSTWPAGMAAGVAVAAAPPPGLVSLTRPTRDWLDAGGAGVVTGALPTGASIRATLSGDASTPFAWVLEHGDDRAGWAPLATLAWERAAPPSDG